MIINLDLGHSISGPGTGASGLMSEVDVNRKVGSELIKLFHVGGHTVNNCTVDYATSTSEQLKGIVTKSNSHKCDLFVSLHLNSGGGRGTETYVCTGASKSTNAIATRVNNSVSNSCNFVNRGVKEAGFYVLKNTTAPAILVEICFVDSPEDSSKLNVLKIAKALYTGITGQVAPEEPTTGELYYRVVCGSFKDKSLAEQRASEVENLTGFDAFFSCI